MSIGIMESEGLFLKNYLGTVSAVPRPRTAPHMETRTSYVNPGHGGYQKYKNHSLENGLPNHARIIYELGASNENETNAVRKAKQSEINGGFEDIIQVENDEEKEKKKEKKWSIGGLFRRKSKKDADDSSEESDEENKRGFLSRRKSKRERRKLKARSTANGFDVVIPQQKEKSLTNGVGLTAEQLWSGDGKTTAPAKPPEPPATNGPVRYIHRHQNEIPKASNSLQVPKHCRKDSKSSGGSESLEGRKGRKEVMARAEAKRDMIRDDSSSDEYESYHSNSSLNRLDPSQRRPRRSDRHNKRLSRDEDHLIMQKENDLRLIKSDLEGRRHPSRWVSRNYYPDSSDPEAMKFYLMNHSGTPSPTMSPRARQKHLMQYMSMMQNAYPTSTFPPGIHHQQMRNVMPPPQRNHIYAKENYSHGSQPFINYRNQPFKGNRNSEFIQNLPRSISNIDNNNRRTLMDYEQFLSSCGTAKEKSMSYDQDIHRASYFQNEPEGQLPITKPNSSGVLNSRRTLLNDEKRDVYNVPQNALNGNGVVENRTESTPSLSIQPGNFPHQPTQIVQRSASGNSFCESSKNFIQNRSHSYQHIPNNFIPNRAYRPPLDATPKRNIYYWSHDEGSKSPTDNMYGNVPQPRVTPPTSPVKPVVHSNASILRYYADQNPRSRNPIHITCNPMTTPPPEQPYLSDSQVVVKPVQSRPVASASDFWKQKDQEVMQKTQQKRAEMSALKPPPTSDRSRSNSPRLREMTKSSVNNKLSNGNVNQLNGICSENKPIDYNNRKILKEEYNVAKVNRVPPDPPIRRLSKQEVLARLHKCEQMKIQENELNKDPKLECKAQTSNLDDALNELEVIYNSLRLKDEDLVDRAERRDLPVYKPKEYNHVAVRDKIQNFYAETDYTNNQPPKNSEFVSGHQRALPLRKSGVPDKKADDMAFRRMNSRDKNDSKKFPSQSYLRSSPVLSPVLSTSPTLQKESSEPDITFDDVVFRNIRHANSTLKIQDPQPPFGIPIGVISPAPNSDYLHAMPKERFRPTFTSSKTPDVVKDDLAFRNLRKDNKTGNCLIVDSVKNDANGLLKKRAVRSLSANLYNIMQKNNSGCALPETNNNSVILDKNCEKTQSLTDLTKEKWAEKQALEKRLKELKEEKNAKRAEFFELSQERRRKSNGGNLSWTDLANLNGDFENLKKSEFQQKIQVNFPTEDPNKSPEKKSFRSPVVELSKYPAAAPSSTLQGNPFKEKSATSPVDEEALESLLTALAAEAKNASKDLERQLSKLETKTQGNEVAVKSKPKATAIEEFNAKFKSNSAEKAKRRRNLSLSNTYEVKEDERKTGSLERRRRRKANGSSSKTEDLFQHEFNEFLRKAKKTNETKEENVTLAATPEADQGFVKKEKRLSKSDSSSSVSSKERKSSQTFEVVTDLSQIIHDVEVEQHLNNEMRTESVKNTSQVDNKDVFQEVYEYNCRLPSSRKSSKGAEELNVSCVEEKVTAAEAKVENQEDIDSEFEKLHEEVNSSTNETKEPSAEDPLVDDLMADITSVKQSTTEAYSSFPFPNEQCSAAAGTSERSPRNRDGTCSGSSKGEGKWF